jgi:hypothetical protein
VLKPGGDFHDVAIQKEGKKIGKPAVKARVVLGHGANKSQHPVKSQPALHQFKQKVVAGDIASITIIGVTCAVGIIVFCILLSKMTKKTAIK